MRNNKFITQFKQPDIDKICLYTNDPFEAKRQFLIKKRKSAGLKHFKDSKAFIEYSNYMDNTFKNIEEYNPNKKCKILFVLDDIIADTLSNKKLNTIVTELFIRGRKLNISLDFNAQSYFCTARKCQTKSLPKKLKFSIEGFSGNCEFYTLFHYKNLKQMRASTNCV